MDRIRSQNLVVTCALSLFLLLSLWAPAPAQAHDQIVGQAPAHNEHFDSSPAEIVLTFNNEPLDLGNIVMVVDADGEDHAVGEPQIHNFTVTQPIAADLADGYYQVRWRVVSSDGHPISESFLFSVGEVNDDTPKPSINAGNPTIENIAPATDQGTEPSSDIALSVDELDIADNGWRTAFFALGGAVIAAIIVGLTLLIRKPQIPQTHMPQNPNPEGSN